VHLSLVYDTLTWKDETGTIPWLAERWEASPDGLTWVFHLRRSVRWQDGVPFTARDVRFTFEYLRQHPVEWFPVERIDRVETPDDATAVFHLKAPYAPFLGRIAGNVVILPEHIWRDVSNPRGAPSRELAVGTGPYRLAGYDKAQGAYEYEANPHFFLGPPRISKIRFVPAPDPVAALEAGAVDQASVPASLLSRFQDKGRFQVKAGPSFWVLALQMNRARFPFSEPAARHALAHAIDRRILIERAVPGGLEGAKPASPGFLPPDSPWVDPSWQDLYPFDPARARSLLQSLAITTPEGARVAVGPDGSPMTFTLVTTQAYLREAEMLKGWLGDIGFALEIKSLDMKAVDSAVHEGRFDLALAGHGGLGGDPSAIMGFGALKEGAWSAQAPASPEFLEAAGAMQSVVDPEERMRLARRMQQLYAEELPTVPLYYTVSLAAYRPEVLRGWFYTAEGGIAIGVPMVLNKVAFIRGE
jgi:peptide/nickel transport system substrate-binding protein